MKTPIQYCEAQSVTHVLMLDGQWHEVSTGSLRLDGPYATWISGSGDDASSATRITCVAADIKGVKQTVPQPEAGYRA